MTRNISIISCQFAAAIQPFVSRDENRYYITGFCVQKHAEGGTIAATTGAVLGVFYDSSAVVAKDGDIVRLSKDAIRACKAKQRCPMSLYLDHDTRMAYVAPTVPFEELPADLATLQGITCIQPKAFVEDATFVDWRRVCPKAPSLDQTTLTCFDPEMLSAFGDVGRDMIIHAYDAGSPAWVLFGDVPEFVGVIMPRRGSVNGLPAWFDTHSAPAQAAAE